jgi:hypothetical protein
MYEVVACESYVRTCDACPTFYVWFMVRLLAISTSHQLTE